MKYPRHPKRIPVHISRRDIEDGILAGDSKVKITPLSDKLDDYLIGLGFTSVHITGICTQLLTQGKVRIDFRNYTERLELVNSDDRLSALQAVSLLSDYITELSKGRAITGPRNTQNITVEPQTSVRDLEREKEMQQADSPSPDQSPPASSPS